MSNDRNDFANDALNYLRGLCMGAADIVPGVSGGTIALILGHYQRLITSIGKADSRLLEFLRARKFRQAAEHIDLRFLIALAVGILTGIVALASLMHYLLEHQQAYTYALFFGLILGSSWLVARQLATWRWIHTTVLAIGAVVALQICWLTPVSAELTPAVAFLAATVAICAMILPGISGAFILLLLGLYHPVTEIIKGLPRGEITGDGLLTLAAFGSGCVLGLLVFTRVLKWLLATQHDVTMAFLVGLMLGSLYKIWPFQELALGSEELPFKEQRFELVAPWESEASLPLVVLLVIVSLAGTLALQRLASRGETAGK